MAMEDTREPPGMVLEWLHILNLNQQDISGLCGFNVEGTGHGVDSSEIHILDIIGRVVVVYLASGPVNTFNLDDFVVRNGADCRNCIIIYALVYSAVLIRSQHTVWVPSILV